MGKKRRNLCVLQHPMALQLASCDAHKPLKMISIDFTEL